VEPAGQDLVEASVEPPRFTYGRLPAVPVQFDVAPEARQVVFLAAGTQAQAPAKALAGYDGDAWVALFGPGDERVATVDVPPGHSAIVHVEHPGRYVAALLAGNASVGADAAPSDFALTPARVSATDLPAASASPDGYGQSNATFTPDAGTGVLFDARPVVVFTVSTLPSLACGDEALRLLEGETPLAAWHWQWGAPVVPAGALLHGGPATAWSDSTGNPSGCPHEAIRFLAYHRT